MKLLKASLANCSFCLNSTCFTVSLLSIINVIEKSFLIKQSTIPFDWVILKILPLNEKKQVQSAHFSGRQHTFHNTVIQGPDAKILYVYYLPDDINHDSVMTFHIIRDILKHHPQIIEKGALVLHPDNCQEQYKCKFKFYEMKNLGTEFGINILWFYGEP